MVRRWPSKGKGYVIVETVAAPLIREEKDRAKTSLEKAQDEEERTSQLKAMEAVLMEAIAQLRHLVAHGTKS